MLEHDQTADHPEMRRIFKGFKMQTVDINYTIGGAGKGKKAVN